MNSRSPIVYLIGLIVLLGGAYIVWWLVSPLFIDNTVDEGFPFEVPTTAELEAMSDAERAALEAELMDSVPTEEELAALTEEERAALEEAVQGAASVVMMDTQMEEAMPEGSDDWLVAASGSFVDADAFHQGSGSATIFQQGDQQVLRFEDFTVTNGPQLHVILVKHPNPASRSDVGEDYIDLGPLKGNMGNQNYDIPAGVDLSEYQSVVIYCVPFHVVFSVATLSG